VNKKVMESFIKGGALDSLGMGRAQMLENLSRVLDWAQRQQEDREQGQFSLFGGPTATATITVTPSLEPVSEWDESERLAHEKRHWGFILVAIRSWRCVGNSVG
jgi:DNA polymerase-3 subunit alpha